MSAAARKVEAAAAVSNVARLPTAVDRKVHQPTPRRCHMAVQDGTATRLPVQWMTSAMRRHAEDEAAFATLKRTPELLLVMALLNEADDRTRARVLGTCVAARIANPDFEAAAQAVAIADRLCNSKGGR